MLVVVVGVVPMRGADGARTRPALRLDALQMVGTHNSYHLEPPPPLFDRRLAYGFPSLGDQLSRWGMRQVEFDVWADPDGTRWRPLGTRGFKVFHLEQVDMDSVCDTFVECLRQLKRWSDGHPRHLPIAVLIEAKDDVVVPTPPRPVPITTPLLDELDREVRKVMKPRDLITPDDVRRRHRTLEEAVLARRWPTVHAARGKFIFLLNGRHGTYLTGHPSLEGRVMFASSTPGQPDAAFVKIDDPTEANQATIRRLVRRGYLVRTLADEPVLTPQSGDVSRRTLAFTSGAHWISTNYPVPGLADRWETSYVVAIPGGDIARCNPLVASPACTGRHFSSD